jgi:hypothetical protein
LSPRLLAAAVTAAALSLLDLLRPSLGDGLRPWQWAFAGLALALLAGYLRGRGMSWRQAAPYLALAAAVVPTWIDHPRVLNSDGVGYYTYLRSLIFDLDLDLTNDFVLFGLPGDGLNVLPIGVALLWAPLVLPLRVALGVASVVGFAEAPRGDEPVLIAAVCQASLLYAGAGLFLLMGALRTWVSPAAAFWATLLCWIGTPLRFYTAVLPSLAHAAEFFAAVLALRTFLALRDRPGPRQALLAGAACGLVFLVRSQDGLLLAMPGLLLLFGFFRGPERRAALRSGIALGGGFLAVAWFQLVVWQVMFGTPVLVPHKVLHGSHFVLEHPEYLRILASPEGGLFTSYPLLLLGLVGLLVLARRDRRYVVLASPVLVAGWALCASIFDWYHIRRFTGLVPVIAPGLASIVAPLTRAGIVPMLLVAFLALRYDTAIDRLRSQQGEPAPVSAALEEMAAGLGEDAYELLEPLAPRLAVSLLDAWADVAVLEGSVIRLELASEEARLRLPHRARHLSAPELEDGAAARWVTGSTEARLFLATSWDGPVVAAVRARALETRRPQSIELLWNGVSAGRHPTEPRWLDYRFDVPETLVHPGTNVLVLRFERRPIYHRIRGEGPRQVRPAALETLTLWRR